MMAINPIKQLTSLGQSIWLDDIRRDLILTDKLGRLIEEDGLRGITSNPALFEKAMRESQDYDESIRKLVRAGNDAKTTYESISQHDVRHTADVFLPVYIETDGMDGYVSLEVSPHLAHDTHSTIDEARRLWAALDRPNVHIKIPATKEGLPAISQLISDGININVTLLFGLPRYRDVVEAYLSGIESRVKYGKPVKKLDSVASFFLSRIDTLVDPLLETVTAQGGPKADVAIQLKGQVAIASAKMAYQIFKEIFNQDRFKKLASNGARVQRLLWASTGTKNPQYRDVKYVESLIGPNTVNTVPLETLDAFRDHGIARPTLEQDVEKSRWILQELQQLGIHIDYLTEELENQGVAKFNKPFDALMATLAQKASTKKIP
jgi:transaldolase